MRHNCSETQEKLVDLIFDELDTAEKKSVLGEIASCSFCQTELAALQGSWQSFVSSDDDSELSITEWQTFETTLLAQFQPKIKPRIALQNVFSKFFFASVRIPVPVLGAGLLVCGAATFLALQSFETTTTARNASAGTPEIVVQEKIIEKPIEKVVEKTLEKIVVRERTLPPQIRFINRQEAKNKSLNSTYALKTPEVKNKAVDQINLAEFKPVVQPSPSVTKRKS